MYRSQFSNCTSSPLRGQRRQARCVSGEGWHLFQRRCGTSGFTLIEILVVVVILGILAAIVVPRVMERPGEARVTRARQDIQGIVTALSLYKLDNFVYPTTEQGLDALVSKPSGQPEAPNWKGPYLERVAKDPWGKPYMYQQPGQHGEFDIYSYGADGKPGGDGEAADVGNWDQ